jgi:hypothetical protein
MKHLISNINRLGLAIALISSLAVAAEAYAAAQGPGALPSAGTIKVWKNNRATVSTTGQTPPLSKTYPIANGKACDKATMCALVKQFESDTATKLGNYITVEVAHGAGACNHDWVLNRKKDCPENASAEPELF